MSAENDHSVTGLISAAAAGDAGSAEKLVTAVYGELRALAGRWMAAEPRDHTLQPTALVHEAYLRLVGAEDLQWRDRYHFFAAAARAMRRILVDRARRYRSEKHGAGRSRVALDSNVVAVAEQAADLILLDQCMNELEETNERQARIVTLRYYAGLGVEETAQVLEISPRTVKREWRFARAWLFDRMKDHDDPT